MQTTKYTLTQTPQKINTGTMTTYIQLKKGKGVVYTLSQDAPASKDIFFRLLHGKLNAPSGMHLWAWVQGDDAIIDVAEYEVSGGGALDLQDAFGGTENLR